MAERNKRVVVGADHYGLPLKNVLRDYLLELGYEVEDLSLIHI